MIQHLSLNAWPPATPCGSQNLARHYSEKYSMDQLANISHAQNANISMVWGWDTLWPVEIWHQQTWNPCPTMVKNEPECGQHKTLNSNWLQHANMWIQSFRCETEINWVWCLIGFTMVYHSIPLDLMCGPKPHKECGVLDVPTSKWTWKANDQWQCVEGWPMVTLHLSVQCCRTRNTLIHCLYVLCNCECILV